VIEVSGIASTSAVGNISLLVTPNPDAPLEERVQYLLRREQEAQKKLNEQDERLRAIEEQLPKRLDELRAETEEHVSKSITEAEWRHRPLRFVGALALLLGLVLTTWANFL
jgi:flagellar motility protein MotE (MotC chaperone)